MVMNTVGHYAFLMLLRNQIAIATEKRIRSNLNEPGGNFIVKLPASALVDWKEQEPLKGYFSTRKGIPNHQSKTLPGYIIHGVYS
jgi:hypothetical protein